VHADAPATRERERIARDGSHRAESGDSPLVTGQLPTVRGDTVSKYFCVQSSEHVMHYFGFLDLSANCSSA
jgi:hypothetical protein